MHINISFRHIEPSDPLKLYVEDKLTRVKKYLEEPIEAHVVLRVEKFRHIAEVSIDASSFHLKGAEETDDMYSSIDLLVDSLEAQAARKGKQKVSRRRSSAGNKESAGSFELAGQAQKSDQEPRIIRAEQVYAKPMHTDEAVMELNLSTSEFMVFTNRSTNRVNVLYKRKDGNLGLIEAVG
ncbi:MAG TPA: ribosome-associated translation inhibitor RaiA [Syntrophobacteraceae bacterium]|nr:ribosome-associated translation inhibitor RaiA [Syntrophobacteraceae bacterium]